MIKLKNNPILLPHQIKILREFFAAQETQDFFLTGGTALSAFYLQHRESKDFDFFSLEPFDFNIIQNLLKKIAIKMNAELQIKVAAEDYHEVYLVNSRERWSQRIDLVRESPLRFGKIVIVDKIQIDSLENIASNKILAIYGRMEPKDYIDTYLILTKTKLKFNKVFEQARQKDAGLEEFYFANMVASAIEKFPKEIPTLKVPFSREEMLKYFQGLSRELLLKIKPKNNRRLR